MKYSDKDELRKSIMGFLRQRLYIYRGVQNPRLEKICIGALKGFGMIEKWNYWRHCLEIKNSEPLLLQILPSAESEHVAIRAHILELIAYCKGVTSVSSEKYKGSDEKNMKKDAMIAHWKRVKLEVKETGNFDNGFNVLFFGRSFTLNDKLNYCDGMIDQIQKEEDEGVKEQETQEKIELQSIKFKKQAITQKKKELNQLEEELHELKTEATKYLGKKVTFSNWLCEESPTGECVFDLQDSFQDCLFCRKPVDK